MHYVGTNEVLIDDLIVFNNETYRCYAPGDYNLWILQSRTTSKGIKTNL